MLAVARANLEAPGLRHVQVRHGDIYALPYPNASADLVTIHQVLHYLDDPGRALVEAARVLKPGGRLMIVDFAPHELEYLREQHAHRRLGIAAETACRLAASAAGSSCRAQHDAAAALETASRPDSVAVAGAQAARWPEPHEAARTMRARR